MNSFVRDTDSEIFPIRVNIPKALHCSWLIDSIVNLGIIFGASVGFSGLYGEAVVISLSEEIPDGIVVGAVDEVDGITVLSVWVVARLVIKKMKFQ